MDNQAIADPTTLLEAVTLFADPAVAHDYIVRMRWPNGVACPRLGCGSADVAEIAGRRKWRCRECKRQFSVKVGTVLEDSPIALTKWLPAMWLLSGAKNGISSCELARALGITQKSAWFMLHRIRCAMEGDSFDLLSGEVEADETYIGGKKRRRNIGAANTGEKPPGPRTNKAIVMGMMERGGDVRAFVVPNDKAATLIPHR
jgi:transposase-like protein